MTHDPEAAWPLTYTETGYQAPQPTSMPPSNLAPRPSQPSLGSLIPASKNASWGVRIAILSIILGVSIPLTAIALDGSGYTSLIKLGIVWVGLIAVALVTLGRPSRDN